MEKTIKKIFRASILNPLSADQWEAFADGALLVEDGIVRALGAFEAVMGVADSDVELEELSGVILPGFVDVHLHWVQHRVRGYYAGELLAWLQEYIWPEEARYVDTDLALTSARQFYADLLRAGTVMGMSYSSPHATATQIALREMRGDWVVGNVLMAINAPEFLTDFSLHAPEALRKFMSETDHQHYAITPRFAPNLSAVSLRSMGRVAAQSNVLIQTHLAESHAEVKWVRDLFPDAANYTDVYDQAGLLTSKTILGHCIEMSDPEWRCLAARGSWVAHCPTSNEALGNRRMPLEKLREFHIPYALASDIGGGPSHSMLHVLQRFLAIHRAVGVQVSAQEALYRATLAGAEAMGRKSIAGNLALGKRADFILLPQKLATNSWESWFEECTTGSMTELENFPRGTWLQGQKVA